jgi:hypothetical protein
MSFFPFEFEVAISFLFPGPGWCRYHLCFFGVFSFDKRFQVCETGGPELPVLLDPGVYGAERFRIEMVNAVAAFSVLAYQMRVTKKTEMLGNRRPGNGKGIGDLSCRLAATAQKIQNSAASGVGERLKSGFSQSVSSPR